MVHRVRSATEGTSITIDDQYGKRNMERRGLNSRPASFDTYASVTKKLITLSEPTDKDMKIIFPSEAKKLWGHSASRVSGTTFLINDPPQFLDHYYQ